MPSLGVRCMLLCMWTVWTVYACMPKNHTLRIERQDCAQCVAVNTTICSGYCYTKDTNFKGWLGRTFMFQRSCVPLSLVYQAVWVPGCPQDVNPQLYYPAAQRCSCRRCDMRTHHCVRTGPAFYHQCTPALGSGKSQNQSALKT